METTAVETKKKDPRAEDVFRISPHRIKINPENIRDIDPKTELNQHLKKTIIKHGVRRVLLLKANPNFGIEGDTHEFICVDGNRRLTMTMEAIADGTPIETVRATIKKRLSDEESLLSMFIDNDAVPLNPMEKAKGVHQLIDVFGWDTNKVAEELGESVSTIKKLYALKQLPYKVQQHIEAGRIAPSLALELSAKTKGDVQLIQTIEEAIAQNITAPTQEVAAAAVTQSGSITDHKNELLEKKFTAEVTGKVKERKKVTARNFKGVVGEKNPVKLLEAVIEKAGANSFITLEQALQLVKGKVSVDETAKLASAEILTVSDVKTIALNLPFATLSEQGTDERKKEIAHVINNYITRP